MCYKEKMKRKFIIKYIIIMKLRLIMMLKKKF
jgi:hypothetical protein